MVSPYTQRIEEIKAAILPLITEVVAAAIEEARQEPNKDEKEETADRYLQKRYIVSDGKGGFTTIIRPEPSPMTEYEVIVDGSDFSEESEAIASPKADAEKIANRILRNIPRYTFTDYIDLENDGRLRPLPKTKPAAKQSPPPISQQDKEKAKKEETRQGCIGLIIIAVIILFSVRCCSGDDKAAPAAPAQESAPAQSTAPAPAKTEADAPSTTAPTAEPPAPQPAEESPIIDNPAPAPVPAPQTPVKRTIDTISIDDFTRRAAPLGDAVCQYLAADTLLTRRMESVTDTRTANAIAEQLPSLIEKRAKAEADMMLALAGVYDTIAAETGEDVLAVAESGKSGHLRAIINTYCNSYDYDTTLADLTDRRAACITAWRARDFYHSATLKAHAATLP